MVVVEPPEPGDPIHTLQKQYDKFDAGVIGYPRLAATGGTVFPLQQHCLPTDRGSPSDIYLHALLGPAASLLADLPPDNRSALEQSARQTFVGSFAGDRPTNDVISKLTAQLLLELGGNAAFVDSAKSNFSLLVLNAVRFLVYVGDTKQSYTTPIAPGAPAPLEVELQKHFHQFLSTTELAGRVGMEHSNIASC